MKVSIVELSSLLKQAFEGCGFDTGACEAAAEMVVACELYGFDSLTKLEVELAGGDDFSKVAPPELLGDIDGEVSLDAANNNVLRVGDLLSNIVFANAVDSGFCVGKINNCSGSSWILRKLLDAQHCGLHAIAYWFDQETKGLTYIARCSSLEADQASQAVELNVAVPRLPRYPEITTVSLTELEYAALVKTQPNLSLTVAVAVQAERLENYLQQSLLNTLSPILQVQSAEQSRQHYLRLLSNGINITDGLLEMLIRLGNKVLVESTEQSRMGAGA